MGSGTFVAETRQNTSFYMEIVKVSYQELVCIKTELEKYAAREAMQKASPEQMRETVEDYYRVLPKNEQRCLDIIGNHREIRTLLI